MSKCKQSYESPIQAHENYGQVSAKASVFSGLAGLIMEAWEEAKAEEARELAEQEALQENQKEEAESI